MFVKKSDGSLEEFKRDKVKRGIQEAYAIAGEKRDNPIINETIDAVEARISDEISTQEIRRFVEEELSKRNFNAAKAYILHWAKKESICQFVLDKERFIEKYKESQNNADATIDDNSNATGKNVSLLNAEIHKDTNILISRAMIEHKLQKLYPNFNSRNYTKDLDSHIIYKHDESSFAGPIAPYTYSAKEVVEVKYNERHLLLPFDLLWEIIEEEPVLVDRENEVYQKYPESLFVRENENKFVQITTITKKKRHRDLVRIKTAFGEDLVVTDNHPMIVDKNNIDKTIEAIDSVGATQFKTNDKLEFGNIKEIDATECSDINEYSSNYCINYSGQISKRYIKVDWNLGYLVGFFVGDGNYNNASGNINFTQKDRTVLVHLNEILFDSIGIVGRIRYKRDKQNYYTMSTPNSVLWWLLADVFHIEDKAENKTLPINFLEYGEEFSKGLLCGLMDADGTVNGSQLSIRLSSRACILQTTALLRYFGYGVGNTIQNLPFSNNAKHFNTNYTIWGVNCSSRQGCVDLGDSFKLKKILTQAKDSSLKYKVNGETKIISVNKIDERDSFLGLNDFIYDITTESRCFSLNNLLVHNCVSISMYPFILNGTKVIGGTSEAPKNLAGYCGSFNNLLFAIASQYAGAVATPEFLLFFDWFARKEWGDDYYLHADEIVSNGRVKKVKTIRSEIEQHFQGVIYSVNSPASSRNSQSPFLNFSYFDQPFFEAMFENFYFPDGTSPKWESLNWLQKEFMKWLNAERLKKILTFPVESFALIYKDGKFVDEENARFVAEELERGHSFFIYISETADSLSSCCFDGKTRVSFDDNGIEKSLTFSELYKKFGNKEISVYSQNPHTNFVGIKKGKVIRTTASQWYSFKCEGEDLMIKLTEDHILPVLRDKRIVDVLVKDIVLGDKLLFNSQTNYGTIATNEPSMTVREITEIKNEKANGDYCYCVEIEDAENPYFILSNGLITHNCRLRNKVQSKEFSFTNGNIGVETGSKSVITLNLSRITQDFCKKEFGCRPKFVEFSEDNKQNFKIYISKILSRVYKYHNAYNEYLWDMYNAGLLPVYSAGFISLNKQYLTIGLNGLNQAAEFLGLKCTKNKRYGEFCRFIFSTVKEENEKHKTKKATFNTEQVPAESVAVKFYNWDKADGYWVPEDTNLYASYIFKPNEECSVPDKLYMMGREFAADCLDGGAAAHINLDSHLSKEQYWKLLKYAGDVGCSYWTVNVPNSECQDCGYITKVPITKCPKCGSEHIDYYDRVIGYLTKVKNWSEGRRIEQKTRKYLKANETGIETI